ncbi:Rv3235 family protein [Xylanimonas sp. McL0601]|uniref:Rv3235 family protein n=1 Tax=Xylanimonas sp. McL0601 TaxID=3414739 RepID=UPI003CEA54EC
MSSIVEHDTTPPVTRSLRVRAVPQRPGRPPEAPTRPLRVRRVRLGSDRTFADDGVEELATARPVVEQPAPPLPDPTAMCCSVVRAAVEVLRGDRAAAQLARWVTPVVLDQLTERARLLREAPAATRPPSGARPVQVRRVRMEVRGETAEATVVLEDHDRVRAAAARLEVRRGQWRIAVLELG